MNTLFTKTIKPAAALSVVLVCAFFGATLVYAQTQLPPLGNTNPPINDSTTGQVKSGGLSVGSLIVNGGSIFNDGISIDTDSGVEINFTGIASANINANTGNSFFIRNQSLAGDLRLGTSNTDRVTIKPNGSVGIGTTTPSPGLLLGVGGNVGAQLYCDEVALNCFDPASVVTAPTGTTGSLGFWNEAGGNVYRSTGNVGIGTATPGKELDVAGQIRTSGGHIITNSPNGALVFNSGPSSLGSVAGFYFRATDTLGEQTGSTDLVRIQADGDVGIGDTSPDGTLKLDVEGQIGATEYCDANGTNCVFAGSLGTGAWTESGGNVYRASGRVGVGLIAPTRSIDTSGDINVGGNSVFFGGDKRWEGGSSAYIDLYSDSTSVVGTRYYDNTGARHGYVYGSANGANFGFLDGDAQWAIRHIKDNQTQFRVNNVTKAIIGNDVSVFSSGLYAYTDLTDTDFFIRDTDKGSVSNVIWYDHSSGRVYLGNTGGSGTASEVTVRGDIEIQERIIVGNSSAAGRVSINEDGGIIALGTGTNTSGYRLEVGVNDDGVNFTNITNSRGFNFSNGVGRILTLAANGNVGIGTTSPTNASLVVNTIRGGSGGLRITDEVDAGNTRFNARLSTSGHGLFEISDANEAVGIRLATGGNATYFNNSLGVSIGSATAPSTGLILDVTGRVGATEYCDENGANCITSTLLGGDNLGDHVATQNVDLANNSLTNVQSISGSSRVFPSIVLDSTSSGDSWTSQGSHISIGEAASSLTSTAAARITYVGNGRAYVGAGSIDAGGVPTGGYHSYQHNSPSITSNASVTYQGTVVAGGGTAAIPGFGFAVDRDTGIYRVGTNQIGITTGGVLRATFDSAGLTVSGPGRFGGGILIDGRTNISADGFFHTARATSATRYGYYEVRDNAGQRGAYFGFGAINNRVDLALENNNNLYIALGDGRGVGIADTTPDGGLRLDVAGNIGGSAYCDDAGNNCSTAAQIATAVNGGGADNLGNHIATQRLILPSGGDANLSSNSGHVRIGGSTGTSISIDDNEIVARDNGAASTLFLNHDGGAVLLSGGTVNIANGRVTAGGAPTAGTHLTNKTYVDAQIAGITGGDDLGNHLATADIRAINGTVSSPSLTFNSDQDTGIYRAGTNIVGIAGGGVLRATFSSTGLTLPGLLRSGNGTAAAPAFSFGSDADTGIYRTTTNQIGITTGGALRATFSSSGITIPGRVTAAAAPTAGSHLTNKTYVDNAIAGLGGGADNLGAGGTTSGTLYSSQGAVGRDTGNRLQFSSNAAFVTLNNTTPFVFTPTEFRINSAGNSGDFDLGASSRRWRNVFSVAGNFSGGIQAVTGNFSGNVEANSFIYTSDKRLKKDFALFTERADNILNLGTYTYNWKDTNKEDFGVIAQEVEKYFPEAVQTKENGYKAVDYARLVTPLLEVTKRQEQEIKELQQSIKELQQLIRK